MLARKHGTCALSDSCLYLALGRVYDPLWAAISNNPTPRTTQENRPAVGRLNPDNLAGLPNHASSIQPRGGAFKLPRSRSLQRRLR